jgi:hypothetical protein
MKVVSESPTSVAQKITSYQGKKVSANLKFQWLMMKAITYARLFTQILQVTVAPDSYL